ncbi:ROK family transcriptional regulator [Phyllobacterium endophyticum]|uniref:ROK family transcriptional regulator n=1 Tax=Phyllobacterium endophyticum TaxID=1149773 RepID=UPI0011B20276|nr:ROK family transcriptional regulator [Phyllobacterium endophyticum]MBB3238031.1 putative NBD/HSP70 family sugar kinase [Phyllobacterium endophyticum]TYR42625.1 ROK family transcriptional regulator [Phyllobacterium endophyticum]
MTKHLRPEGIRLTDVEFAVLRHIRRYPGQSRTQIARHLGVSKSLLTKAAGNFRAIGLVREERSVPQSGERGQPAVRMWLMKDAYHTIGIHLSGTQYSLVRTDLDGNVVEVRLPSIEGEIDAIVETILHNVRDLLETSQVPVLGIGMAIPAIVNEDGALFEVTPTQAKLPFQRLANAMTDHFDLPVYWDNGAYCIASFEAQRSGTSSKCLFYITLDFGIGGGAVYESRLLRGGFNQAANIGALLPETGPRPNLVDLAHYLDVSLEVLNEPYLTGLLKQNDRKLGDWICERGRLLSSPLASVVQLINPDTIILGGFFPREILELMLAQIDLGILDTEGRKPLTKPDLRVATLLGSSGLAQASALLPISARLLGQRMISAC